MGYPFIQLSLHCHDNKKNRLQIAATPLILLKVSLRMI